MAWLLGGVALALVLLCWAGKVLFGGAPPSDSTHASASAGTSVPTPGGSLAAGNDPVSPAVRSEDPAPAAGPVTERGRYRESLPERPRIPLALQGMPSHSILGHERAHLSRGNGESALWIPPQAGGVPADPFADADRDAELLGRWYQLDPLCDLEQPIVLDHFLEFHADGRLTEGLDHDSVQAREFQWIADDGRLRFRPADARDWYHEIRYRRQGERLESFDGEGAREVWQSLAAPDR